MKTKANTSTADEPISIPKNKIRKLVNDAVKTAEAVDLVYVNGNEPGINRVRQGKSFKYIIGSKTVKNKNDIKRINSLVIPPAWEDVWICILENGHLQATGIDLRKRKQYRYHSQWNQLRSQTKFYHIYEFGKALPGIREQLKKDISLPGLPAEKVLATVVTLMERTNIRVGNNMYEKIYGSFGLTTLKDKHVSFNGNNIGFSFKGKKGVEHTITLKSKKLLNIVKKCRDIPGKELFQYYNEAGERKTIDSGMVNNYIKKISGGDFTAKDFRTWSGTVYSLNALKELGMHETETEAK
ncbi:MAG: DNA topoisomerase IB, partial [Bacteroidota bacterium]